MPTSLPVKPNTNTAPVAQDAGDVSGELGIHPTLKRLGINSLEGLVSVIYDAGREAIGASVGSLEPVRPLSIPVWFEDQQKVFSSRKGEHVYIPAPRFEDINLFPGTNKGVSLALLNRALHQDKGLLDIRFRNNAIRLHTPMEGQPGDRLLNYSPEVAWDLIASTYNIRLLEDWLLDENRPGVLNAGRERLEKLKRGEG